MTDHQGLPDLQSLAAMANEFFQALPNAEPIVSGLRPQLAQNTPQNFPQKPQFGRSLGIDVSEASLASAPAVPSREVEKQTTSLPASNYYFADNASAYPLANLQIDQLATQVSPQAFGLPSDDELRSLLAEDRFVTNANQNSFAKRPHAPSDLHISHALENNAGSYHQQQTVGADRVSPNASGLPGEQDIQQLLAAEFNVSKFDAPASPAAKTPESQFYFLDSNAQPVFGNSPKQGQFTAESQGFDVQSIRRDFPILSERVNGKPLVWFDNAATTQKPTSVIERVSFFLRA